MINLKNRLEIAVNLKNPQFLVSRKNDNLTCSRLSCMKNCLRLNEILTIFDHEKTFILILFWKTTNPIDVTPNWISLFAESYCKKKNDY